MAIQQLSAAKLKKTLDDLEAAGYDLNDFEVSVSQRIIDDSPMDIQNYKHSSLKNKVDVNGDAGTITLFI